MTEQPTAIASKLQCVLNQLSLLQVSFMPMLHLTVALHFLSVAKLKWSAHGQGCLEFMKWSGPSKRANMHMCIAVPLVWGLLSLVPSMQTYKLGPVSTIPSQLMRLCTTMTLYYHLAHLCVAKDMGMWQMHVDIRLTLALRSNSWLGILHMKQNAFMSCCIWYYNKKVEVGIRT